jgi:hypothetical protein
VTERQQNAIRWFLIVSGCVAVIANVHIYIVGTRSRMNLYVAFLCAVVTVVIGLQGWRRRRRS